MWSKSGSTFVVAVPVTEMVFSHDGKAVSSCALASMFNKEAKVTDTTSTAVIAATNFMFFIIDNTRFLKIRFD